jgi:hypothetical protein
MPLQVKKVDVWAGDLRDVPGGLADALETLASAGADLEFIIARRDPSRPGTGQVFLTPIRGRKGESAAQSAGLNRASDMGTLRIEGTDRPGLGHQMTRAIANAGINVKGVSAAVIGNKFIAYLGFDSTADADAAARTLKNMEAAAPRKPLSRTRRTMAGAHA